MLKGQFGFILFTVECVRINSVNFLTVLLHLCLLSLEMSLGVNGVIWPAKKVHILKSFRITDTGEQYWVSLREKEGIFNFSSVAIRR